MKRYYWDIETEGLPVEQIQKLMPEFEAAGNVKDPVKIAAQIEEKKAAWLDGTALKAITGKIIAVTVAVEHFKPEMITGSEEELIENALEFLEHAKAVGSCAYAWNGSGFDLPFLCQRAAVHNKQAFSQLTTQQRGRFYWYENFIDPKMVWSNYSPDHTGTSLKSVSLALGVGEKKGDGKDFAALLKTNPKQAEEYAINDVSLLRAIVGRMGI